MTEAAEAGCLFCRIVSGELPSVGLVSTESTYAFSDIEPVAPVHVLVVPREHIADADQLRDRHGALLAEMFATAQAAARAQGVAESGYRMIFNVGADALNSVAHLHLHVIGGRRLGWPPG